MTDDFLATLLADLTRKFGDEAAADAMLALVKRRDRWGRYSEEKWRRYTHRVARRARLRGCISLGDAPGELLVSMPSHEPSPERVAEARTELARINPTLVEAVFEGRVRGRAQVSYARARARQKRERDEGER